MVRLSIRIIYSLKYLSGTLSAAWTAKDPGFKFGSIVLLLIPVSIGVMFAISSIPIPKKPKEAEEALQCQNDG